MKKTLSLFVALFLLFSLISCGKTDTDKLWDKATYTADAEFGEGEKTVEVEVKIGDRSVTFTIHSDEQYLGDALIAHSLISGKEGAYGLYIETVNGVLADYDVDQSYWGFYQNGEYMLTGIDLTEFSDGEHYELVYTK